MSGGNVNQNSSTSPSENCTEGSRRRRSSSGSSKSKTSQQSNSDTKIDKRRKRSQSEESVGSWTTSSAGSAVKSKEKSTSSVSSVRSTVSSFSKTSFPSSGGNTLSGKSSASSAVENSSSSRSRKKSGSVSAGSSTLSNINLDSASGVRSRSSKVSVSSSKTRRSSGSSLTSVSSEGLLSGNCEKCRQVKKGRKGKDTEVKVKSTRTWSVSVADLHTADSKSVITPEKPLTSLSDTLKGKTEDTVQSWTSSIKLSLRPSTQAQSKAEVGTYRVSRKRSNTTKSSTSVVQPVAKCSKVESRTDSDIKSEKRIEVSVVNQGIHEQALPQSFLIAGPSFSRDFPSQPPKKKCKLDKKSKKRDKNSHKLESPKGATGSSASKSSPPELNSLRRHTRTKKTGSCASSRWVFVLSEFI